MAECAMENGGWERDGAWKGNELFSAKPSRWIQVETKLVNIFIGNLQEDLQVLNWNIF
jgi:hypothetical protein